MTKKIIAATGCPTGIAHTFMAKKALEDAAEKKGISIKVETHGQVGVENELTDQEIEEAYGVIIAADKDVDEDRFIGKRVIKVSVSKGIKEPDELIKKILSDDLPPFKEGKQRSSGKGHNQSESEDSYLHKIYVYLMNGVSHMIPVVVAGGVLLAVSFMFGIHSGEPGNAQFNPFAFQLKSIGAIAMGLMVPILSAYIAEAIGKRPGLIVGFITGMIAFTNGTGFLGGIVSGFLSGYIIVLLEYLMKNLPKQLDGLKAIFLLPVLGTFAGGLIMFFLSAPMSTINHGMMNFVAGLQNSSPFVLGLVIGMMCAFDMGGPINKAAYLTGTALLAQGNYFFMAGVSAACIAPPLATGFAVLFAKNAYTVEERNAGYVNFLLGSTHITEGAIPFAAKKPLIVIPFLMIGSSIAAILTYYMKIQVPAPHGGFIILPIVNHPFLWVMDIVIGALVAGFLIAWDQKRTARKENRSRSNFVSEPEKSENETNDEQELSLLTIDNIYLENNQIQNKKKLFHFIAEKAFEKGYIMDRQALIDAFDARESLGSTGMEGGFAIPHAQTPSIKKSAMFVIKTNGTINDWKTLDGQPVTIVIAYLIPENGSAAHMHYLSDMAQKLMNQQVVNALHNARTKADVFHALNVSS
ncbi:PTS fructose transporter subunit IIABC [Sporolactobacillus shoreae]|uniref:PTS fructose transporter subunit IIABC n=1 Tax=Sporolactobacillus shoreae TaxID=1465501 RepID=A0A4Z0GQU8_9BACL|nr:fructose-specific PTS transporter subunit EIIC [Sporolactobacillus shoreae]TGA98507.1 PTS fructose transporter subunit IIABC [Sporolactobacillus shoreae]